MPADFVHGLGPAFLAHRLRRVSELILAGSAEALPGAGVDAPPRAGSTLLLLQAQGPMGVTEIAQQLRLSHPLIIRLTDALADAGLVTAAADAKDQRRRLIGLTDKGQNQAARLATFSLALARTFAALAEETGTDLFAALAAFERAADRRPLAERIAAALAQETQSIEPEGAST